MKKSLLEKLDNAVKKTINDASSEARSNGYRALKNYQKIAPVRAAAIVDNFSRAVKKKYDAVTTRRNST